MEMKEKRKELEEKFLKINEQINTLTTQINSLATLREQLRGQIILVDELDEKWQNSEKSSQKKK